MKAEGNGEDSGARSRTTRHAGPAGSSRDRAAAPERDDDAHAEEVRAVLDAVATATRVRSTSKHPRGTDREDAGDELQVVLSGDVAFVVRLGEPELDASGRAAGARPRTTYGLSRIGRRWVVVHEHAWRPGRPGSG